MAISYDQTAPLRDLALHLPYLNLWTIVAVVAVCLVALVLSAAVN